MKKYIMISFVLFIAACNANLTPDELKTKLETTMNDFLYKSVNYDSSKVKFRVQDVVYYNDKDYYDCEFKVWMSQEGKPDTTGSMRARVSKDFKTVVRNY